MADVVQALLSGIPAGVFAGAVTIWGWRAAGRVTRRTEYLRAQIEKLYGPLGFLVMTSERYIALNNRILTASHDHFYKRHSEKAEKEMQATMETANRYIDSVVANNKVAVGILRDHWAWLDEDDRELALKFCEDLERHRVEWEEGRRLPLPMYMEGAQANVVGTPSFIEPQFIERIRERLNQKQRELAGLTGSPVSLLRPTDQGAKR